MTKERYIQIGVTSLRTPTGEFLPPIPLYIKVADKPTESGLTPAEEALLRDVASVFADRHSQTIETR